MSSNVIDQALAVSVGMWFGERCYDISVPKQNRTSSGKIERDSETLAQVVYDPLPVYRSPSQAAKTSPEKKERFPLMFNTGARI